jgi:hypothetical protein
VVPIRIVTNGPGRQPGDLALLTGDSTRVHEIVRAQRAILNRYLQLASGWEAQPEEKADLGNAIDILEALKRMHKEFGP